MGRTRSWGLRNDCSLDVVGAVHQFAEDLADVGEARASGDVFAAFETAADNQIEGAASGPGRVMEGGFHDDVVVVQTVRVELDFCAGGTSAEEVDRTAFPDQFDGLLPGGGGGDGLDGNVYAAMVWRKRAYSGDHVLDCSDLDDFFCAEDLCCFNLLIVLDYGDDTQPGKLGRVDEHKADGARADDGDGIAWLRVGFLQSASDAGKRLGERGVLEGNSVGNMQCVLFDNARRDADVFGVGSVVEDEVIAEVLLSSLAEVALIARGGVERDDAVANLEIGDASAHFFDGPGQFVAERDGWLEHFGVVAAAVDFKVSAAGERGCDADDDFARPGGRHREFFDAQVFLTVEHGGCHRVRHHLLFSQTLRPGWRKTFMELAVGLEAISMASTAFWSGKR